MSSFTFSVGQRVRINSREKNTAVRGMIVCQNADGTYEIMYDSNSECFQATDLELIAPLEKFESLDLMSQSNIQKKEYGNILFKLRDFAAAILYYKSALHSVLEKITVYDILLN